MKWNAMARGYLMLGFLALAVPVLAHHSFAAEYRRHQDHLRLGHPGESRMGESAHPFLCEREGQRRQGDVVELRGLSDHPRRKERHSQVGSLLANLRKEVTVRAVPARTSEPRSGRNRQDRGWRGAHRRRPEVFR